MLNPGTPLADTRTMGRPQMISLVLAAFLAVGTGSCALPSDRFPAEPTSDLEFEEYLDELNDEAERQMEEMMRENEDFLSQFDSESDSLPVTGLGG